MNINPDANLVRVGMDMALSSESVYLEGTLKWYKVESGTFHYGIKLDIPEADKDRLPLMLRTLAGEGKLWFAERYKKSTSNVIITTY